MTPDIILLVSFSPLYSRIFTSLSLLPLRAGFSNASVRFVFSRSSVEFQHSTTCYNTLSGDTLPLLFFHKWFEKPQSKLQADSYVSSTLLNLYHCTLNFHLFFVRVAAQSIFSLPFFLKCIAILLMHPFANPMWKTFLFYPRKVSPRIILCFAGAGMTLSSHIYMYHLLYSWTTTAVLFVNTTQMSTLVSRNCLCF